jgi:hypothetical protein
MVIVLRHVKRGPRPDPALETLDAAPFLADGLQLSLSIWGWCHAAIRIR